MSLDSFQNEKAGLPEESEEKQREFAEFQMMTLRFYMKNLNFDQAISLFNNHQALFKTYLTSAQMSETQLQLGTAYEEKGDLETAIELY